MTFTNPKEFPWKRFAGAFIALVTVVLIELLFNTSIVPDTLGTNVFQAIERRSFDLLMRFRGVRANASNIIMINIDDYTDKQLGWPIPRDQYGAALTLVSNSGAKAVALDVTLPPRKDKNTESQSEYSKEDTLLIQYLSKARNVYQVFGPWIPSKTEREQVSRQDVDSTAYMPLESLGYRLHVIIIFPAHHLSMTIRFQH